MQSSKIDSQLPLEQKITNSIGERSPNYVETVRPGRKMQKTEKKQSENSGGEGKQRTSVSQKQRGQE